MTDLQSPTDTGKPWWQSKTIVAVLVGLAARVAAAAGVMALDADTEAVIVAWLLALGPVMTDAVAIWGRLVARRPIAGVADAPPESP